MIKMGSDVDIVLRETVMQMEHIGEDRLGTISTSSHSVVFFIQYSAAYVFSSSLCVTVLRPRESHLLENVPYCDQPRKRS